MFYLKRASVYALVGAADPNNPQYSSVTSMTRVYIGVNTRSTDISEKTTYRAARIVSVILISAYCMSYNTGLEH